MRANLTQHRLVQSRQDKIHEPHNCNAQRVHLRPDFGWQDFCKNQPGHRTVPSLELKLNNRDFKDRKVHIILKIKFVIVHYHFLSLIVEFLTYKDKGKRKLLERIKRLIFHI